MAAAMTAFTTWQVWSREDRMRVRKYTTPTTRDKANSEIMVNVTEHPRSRLSNALENDGPDRPSYLTGTFKN